jgi:cell division protein FtsB
MSNPKLFQLTRVLLLAACVGLIGMGAFAKRGALDWKRIARRSAELQAQIDRSYLQKQSLERQVESLQSDPEEQERVIRQVLGYVKPRETVIEF